MIYSTDGIYIYLIYEQYFIGLATVLVTDMLLRVSELLVKLEVLILLLGSFWLKIRLLVSLVC